MKVVKTSAVNTALRTLAEDERRVVSSWFDHLGNWDNDEHIRKMSNATAYKDTYALTTSDDFKIFFTLDEAKKEIVILDLARPSRFQIAGMASE